MSVIRATEGQGLSHSSLVGLTAGKTVVNVAIRWLPFFLPTLGRALGASTAQMTSVIGLGETAGFLSAAVGKWLDRGHERLVMTAGMALVGVSTLLAIVGSFALFVVAQFLLMLGVSLYTVAGHAYISRHVRFEQRGRSIGIFEVSWALGLFIGAPAAALLIDGFSWRAPFIAVGILAFFSCAALLLTGSEKRPSVVPERNDAAKPVKLNTNAWMAIAASAGIALAGLSTIVVIGTWMEETLGISIDGIGLVAMGFGAVELLSSSSSASFSDRLGKNRSTRLALLFLLLGLVVMSLSTAVVVAVLGVVIFFLGFEYAIVTSFSVVSEAMPSARGRVLSVNMAVGTVARGVGSIASGFVFESFGITGTSVLAGAGAVLAIAALGRVEGT